MFLITLIAMSVSLMLAPLSPLAPPDAYAFELRDYDALKENEAFKMQIFGVGTGLFLA